MDVNGVEQVNVTALGGADTITVNDLTGTGVTQVESTWRHARQRHGDGQADTVIVNGTAGADTISGRRQRASRSSSTGLAATGDDHGRRSRHRLARQSTPSPATTPSTPPRSRPAVISLTLNGGDGDDLLIGSAGNDLIIGGRGNDVAFMGAGDDTFVWNPGDGSDTVEGQAGIDTLLFNGANVNENIDLSANGSRVRLFRDVGNVTMDLNGVEQINVNALGGADTITVNDLSGTDVTRSTSTWRPRPAAAPATARPTPSSSTGRRPTITSVSSTAAPPSSSMDCPHS